MESKWPSLEFWSKIQMSRKYNSSVKKVRVKQNDYYKCLRLFNAKFLNNITV